MGAIAVTVGLVLLGGTSKIKLMILQFVQQKYIENRIALCMHQDENFA